MLDAQEAQCRDHGHAGAAHDPALCRVCHYPLTDGCGNPACGGTPEALSRARAAAAQRASEERERAERMRLWGSSFGP